MELIRMNSAKIMHASDWVSWRETIYNNTVFSPKRKELINEVVSC